MIANPQVPLHRLVLSLSDALDSLDPIRPYHHLQTVYISTNVARHLGFDGPQLQHLFHAAALHDIASPRGSAQSTPCETDNPAAERHSQAGFELLHDNRLFSDAAHIVKHHHAPWNSGKAADTTPANILMASQILFLANSVACALQPEVPPLEQADLIVQRTGDRGGEHFHPDCVDAFRFVARTEAFWLSCTSPRIYGLLMEEIDWPTWTVDVATVESIAHIFGHVVDSLSSWTATHSAGVAASAAAVAERFNFSPRELALIHGAGYLHDLGKLTVPSAILEKPGKLTKRETTIVRGHTYHTFRILSTIGGMPQISEWASFHHERLDGNGYPFHHHAKDLTLGSRIMAVADTFAALAEDRPYRKGMAREDTMTILDNLVNTGGRDGDVVAIIRKDFDAINTARQHEQADYVRKQQRLAEVLHAQPPVTQDAA